MENTITLDALNAMPPQYTLTVNVRYRNLWRIRLAFTVLRAAAFVASKLMGTELTIEPEETKDATKRSVCQEFPDHA